MKSFFLSHKSVFCILISLFIIGNGCSNDTKSTNPEKPEGEWLPATEQVNGSITKVDGITVLKLWGTNSEMGYAHGYLMAPAFVAMLDEYLVDPVVQFDIDAWEIGLGYLSLFEIPAEYQAELQGLLSGMEARAGGKIQIQAFGRALTINDLRGLQSDLDKIHCSSFAAWGDMTQNGGTITGRNMDYDRINVMMGAQILVVRVPSEETGRLAWVSVAWPGEIGCTTGMNEEGVTVSQQDVYRQSSTASDGFTPDNLVHRLMIESCRANSVINDVETVLQSHYIVTGCAPMISWPYSGGSASVVPEFDGYTSITQGYTIREPQQGNAYQIAANHFRERIPAMSDCWRYNLLNDSLAQIALSNGDNLLTTEKAWELLTCTPIPETVAMHSVVFEPNLMLMHLAFAQNNQHAPLCQRVTLDVAELLSLNTE